MAAAKAVFVALFIFLHSEALAGEARRLWQPLQPSKDLTELPQTQPPGERLESAYDQARDEVSNLFANEELISRDLLCSAPARAGFQTKQENKTPLMAPLDVVREMRDDGFPTSPTCQAYISHKFKFIYVRQPKSSSSAVLLAINRQLCGNTCNYQEPDQWGEKLDPQLVGEISDEHWNNYFVFTVVRNPWTRILSTYKFLHHEHLRRKVFAGDDSPPGEKCGMDFEEFTRDTHKLSSLCEDEGCCGYVPHRKDWAPTFVDVHITDQASCTFLPGGESLVDYIGTSSTLNEDWKQIVSEISKRSGLPLKSEDVLPANGDGINECTNADPKGYYDTDSLKNVALQYSMDVLGFGYL